MSRASRNTKPEGLDRVLVRQRGSSMTNSGRRRWWCAGPGQCVGASALTLDTPYQVQPSASGGVCYEKRQTVRIPLSDRDFGGIRWHRSTAFNLGATTVSNERPRAHETSRLRK